MKLVIINPPIRLSDKPRHIPHGLAILAGMIRKNLPFVEIHFIDWNAYRYSENEMRSILAGSDFDVVMIGGLIPVYKNVIKLSRWIKEINPGSKIISGGSVAMSQPELLLRNSDVDVVCTGEGEKTILDLLSLYNDNIKSDLNGIKGTAFLNSDNDFIRNDDADLIKDLDTESCMPDYDILPMDIYLNNNIIGLGREIDFISSRGCPYKCTFCYQPWGRRFRGHSVEFITEAILYLSEKYGIDFVCFQDDEFMAKPSRVIEFCEARNRYFPHIKWSSTGRANIVTDEIMKTVRNSGCCSVSYGFESGSPEMLKRMRKGVTLDQMSDAVNLNRKYGFPIPVSFILGMPGETEKTCEDTLSFCRENNLNLSSLMFATPYPGTNIFDFAVQTGRIDTNNLHDYVIKLGDARDFLINLTDEFSDEELVNKYNEMQKRAQKDFKPFTEKEINTKIKSLYGYLADKYMSFDESEQEHRAKHGGINIF